MQPHKIKMWVTKENMKCCLADVKNCFMFYMIKVILSLLKLQPALDEETIKDQKASKLRSSNGLQAESYISIKAFGDEVLYDQPGRLLQCLSFIA